MGRAEDLFRRLSEGGEAALDDLINDRQSEELFLDFKRSADSGAGTRLHTNDRKNLARAISGFGNSEGGVLMWGVDVNRDTAVGDVAGAKVPIQNPRRFQSWLEGAVSGCTVPPHPHVIHAPILRTGADVGFVITHVAKSYIAPHQCIEPQQFYIRAGSSFVPTPYSVLAGLFGKHPQASIIHMWSSTPVVYYQLRADGPFAAELTLGLMLRNQGPGIARDLYVNAVVLPPRGGTKATIQVPDQVNWADRFTFGVVMSLVSKDGFKLAPQAHVEPLQFLFRLAPPFETHLFYRITFGAQGTPVYSVEARTEAAVLQRAFDTFVTSDRGPQAGGQFFRVAMSIPEPERITTLDQAHQLPAQ